MPEKITYSLTVQVTGGPKLVASNTLSVEAYDKTQVTVTAGATDQTVNIQPGGAGLAQFVAITASQYDNGLTYKVNDAGATAIALNGPHTFIGAGAVGLLNAAPTALLFGNSTAGDITVDILVGRDATP
ncbi:MAG: hypothetical protein R3E79_43880 [Caldilineaceae bacterium]